MANPWERKQIDTDPEGFTLPDGSRYSWTDVQVTLEVKATIVTPNHGNLELGRVFEGQDGREALVSWLNATAA